MQTIRRLYRYLVSFISLEVIVWGLIDLGRSSFSGEIVGANVSQLASALSLVFVGVPVFLLHWIPAQRSAAKNEEERFSRLRGLFLYGALLATLIPIAQNLLAMLNRGWLQLLQLPLRHAFVGQYQNWVDNLIAIVMNGLFVGYLYAVTRRSWEKPPIDKSFPETRRLYHYIWMLYGLAMTVIGTSQIIQFIFNTGDTIGNAPRANFASGLALLMVGAPIWIASWLRIQKSLTDSDDKHSILRLIVLYLLNLIGIGGILIPSGIILNIVFEYLLGTDFVLAEFLNQINIPISILFPLGGVWLYYRGILKSDDAEMPDATSRLTPRRIYAYLLTLIGLVTTWMGLHLLLSFLIDQSINTPIIESDFLQNRLSAALATLIVGLPLWVINWRPIIKEVSQEGESGDHARRSLIRKTYLYLVLFASVIGVMVTSGGLIFELLKAVLGDPSANLLRKSLMLFEMLSLFSLVLVYHWILLRNDIRLAENYLVERHKQFPVLVLASEIGDFTDNMIEALQRESEALPTAIWLTENGAPDESLSDASAIIIPSAVSANPPEAVRLWLQEFKGVRLVVPVPVENWFWVFGSGNELSRSAKRAAKVIRALAEGEDPQFHGETPVWRIVLYVLAGLVGLPIFFSIASMLFSIIPD